ncbi:hypothetical protein G6F55_006147 [Rhizopus delemar]|uniref:Uncharacterized protein n=2 Tax=Rhizopus TaxID=4842 RepID=A0A9P6Z1I0_9FUNG|nr:hypothetical protein G6F55_006147 [Rhizopus delemar]KAG1523347.1 hypothetical protein G6F52_005097 [Rhizopus delemar]KAG1568423.1 hypothetical protein G6F50_007302 [Rhizopus delemar]
MIEGPTERGKVTLHAKDLGINPLTATRWNSNRPNSLTPDHEQRIQQIVEEDSQICADDIIDSLKSQFEDLKISNSTGNSTTDEPTVFNKIALDDYDLEYSSDDFDAPVVKRPFLGESIKSASRITKSTSAAVESSTTASKTSIISPKPSKPVPTAFKSAVTSVKSSFCPVPVDKISDIREGPKKLSKRMMTIKTTNSIYYDAMASPKNHFKAFFRLAELSEDEQMKQFACFPLRTTFIPCYMTLDSKIIHYHILKSKKNLKTGSKFETWGAVVDLNKKAFKHQGFQKSLRFQGTLETDGIGVSIIKQNTNTSRKSPKPNTEKKVNGNQTEHIEGLGQADLKSTEGKCILIDPGRRDLMYCMKEISTVEEKQTLIFTKNNRSKCSMHFKYLRKHTQPFVAQKAEAILSRPESNSVNLEMFVHSVKSQLYATYLQIMLQQKHISERLDDSEKSKVLGLAKEMYRRSQKSNYKKTISTELEKLQLLPFRKLKFSSKLFFDQNDQKLVRSLRAKFGQDDVLVFGDWSASNVKYQESTRSKGLIRMLKKNGFVVYLINEYKTSSHCATFENELEKFKIMPNPRPYQRKKKPDVLCNGLLR